MTYSIKPINDLCDGPLCAGKPAKQRALGKWRVQDGKTVVRDRVCRSCAVAITSVPAHTTVSDLVQHDGTTLAETDFAAVEARML